MTTESADWGTLKHARGSAKEVPAWLEEVRSTDAATRKRALGALENTLFSQAKWYPASARALPLLVAIFSDQHVTARERMAGLIVDVLTGGHEPFVQTGLDMSAEPTRKNYARGPGKQVYEAFQASLDAFARLLDDPQPTVRTAAAFVLSFASSAAKSSQTKLRARLQREDDDFARAGMLVALGLVDRYLDDRGDAPMFATLVTESKQPDVVRGAAVLARAYLDDRPLSDAELAACKGMIQLGDVGRSRWPWCRGRPDMLTTRVLDERVTEGGATAAKLAAKIVEEVGPSHPLALEWAAGALRLSFALRDQPLLASELSEDQRVVFRSLSAFELRAPFVSYGLPVAVRDRRRWIGLDPQGPLDRVVPMTIDGKERAWPLWLSIRARLARKETPADVFQDLSRRLPEGDYVGAYAEATLMAYETAAPWPNHLDEVIDKAGANARPWSQAMLEELLDPRRPFLSVLSYAGNYALAPVVKALSPGQFLEERYRKLVVPGGPAELNRRLFEAIPPGDREALALVRLEDTRRRDLHELALTDALNLFELIPTGPMATFVLTVADELRPQYPNDETICDRAVAKTEELARQYPAIAQARAEYASQAASHSA